MDIKDISSGMCESMYFFILKFSAFVG